MYYIWRNNDKKMNRLFFLFIAFIFLFNKGFSNATSNKKDCFRKNYSVKGDSIKISIPNIFTPNNDGKNDFWSMIVTDGLEMFDLKTNIYNRYGKQVFESTNIHQNWNGNNLYEGNPCSDGTYFYIISYTDGNTDETKTLKGFLEIIK